MRKIISAVLKNTPALQASGVGRRIYAASSLGKGTIPANPKKPFIVFREVDVIATNVAKDTSPNSSRKVYQFYVHDERGSYTRIDNIIAVLRETVRSLTDQVADTTRCLSATWNGTSADTEDPTYDSNLKFVTCTFVSNN